METWQWIKALSAIGRSDSHYQNMDRAISDLPLSGRPSTAVTPVTVQRANSLIRDVRRMTTRELSAILGIGKGSVDKIIHQLGYSKVCARWVPRSLTEEHKQQRKAICSELLARYEVEGDDFLSTIVTGDETQIHHFEPEKKRQSMEWHHTNSPRKKKFKAVP
jgi:histone-lysine N-methyltransferase SETMAR